MGNFLTVEIQLTLMEDTQKGEVRLWDPVTPS